MVKPTIGHRVFFWPTEEDKTSMAYTNIDEPLKGSIHHINGDGTLGVFVVDEANVIHKRSRIEIIEHEGESHEGIDVAGKVELVDHAAQRASGVPADAKPRT